MFTLGSSSLDSLIVEAQSNNLPAAPPSVPDHELLGPIASGAYGEVWLARNVVGTLRAVKIVRRDRHASAESFEREFKGLQKFEPVSRSHDGLVDILTLGLLPAGAGFYYVMELADGVGNPKSETQNPKETRSPKTEIKTTDRELRTSDFGLPSAFDIRHSDFYTPRTLRADLKSRGALAADEVIALGLKLTAALAHLHAHGLVHRDVKPSNILFIGGEPKLADAGLVAAVDDARSLVGTAGYIAPEGPGTPQADLYALGKVLYEAAFGKDRQEFPALPADVASRPDHASLLELNAILLKACTADHRERYQSADQMCADLELLHAGRSVKRRQTWQRCVSYVNKLALGAAALAAVAVIIYSFVVWSPRPPALEWSKNEEANEAYRNGIRVFHENAADSFDQAAKYFELAVALDSGFARANARLARSYTWKGPDDPVMLAKARPFAEKALALNPQSDEAHCAMASIKTLLLRDWAGAEKEHREALRLNPKSEDNLYAYASFLSIVGRTNEAIQQVWNALQLDSRSLVWMQNAAFVFLAARQYDRAIRILEDLVEQQPTRRPYLTVRFLAPAYRGKGDYLKAIDLEEEIDPLNAEKPKEVEAYYGSLRKAYDQGGQSAYWKQLLNLKKNVESNPVRLAVLYARVGESEKAFASLNQALQQVPTQLSFVINREPAFDGLRSDQRFGDLLKKLGLGK